MRMRGSSARAWITREASRKENFVQSGRPAGPEAAGGLRSAADMRAVLVTALCLAAGVIGLMAQARPGTLTIYYIDTEGGQSTLFVGPTAESLLVDTGNAGDRDLGRIVETLAAAGVTRIDHL